MTDEEMAEGYAFEKWPDYPEKQEIAEQAFLAGLKAERPKWHKVADGDLPNCEHGHTVFNQDLDRVIIRNGRFEHLDGYPAKVIAWCEIPKYTDKE